MKDDLKDIDIIDKYLTGALNEAEEKQFKERYVNDPAFNKEVEIYRKIYEGIELAGHTDLKRKLDLSYEEYVKDKPAMSIHVSTRRVNWRKPVYIVSGIAASVCLLVLAYLYIAQPLPTRYAGDTPSNKPLGGQTKDTSLKNPDATPAKKIVPPLSPDSGQKKRGSPSVNDNYAFTGETRLPATAIREASYPQPLSYTFDKRVLTLYGDPLIAMLNLDIFKKGPQYYLVYDDFTYEISPTKTIKPLVKQGLRIPASNTASTEKIQVEVAPITTTAYTKSPLGVVISPGNGRYDYYFTTEKSTSMLVLQGDFAPDNCTVVSLTIDGNTNWYVVSKSDVYIIDQFPDKPVRLKELSALSGLAPRLFNKRAPVEKVVLSFK